MKLKNPMRSIIILFTLIVIVYPVIPLFIQSIAGYWDYRELFPSSLTLDNYISIIDTYNIPEVTLNSIIISSVVVVISLILGIFPAKYIGTRDHRSVWYRKDIRRVRDLQDIHVADPVGSGLPDTIHDNGVGACLQEL